MEYANKINGEIKIFNFLPNKFGTCVGGYNKLSSERHKLDGFKEFISVVFDNKTHKIGEVYYDELNDNYKNSIISKTVEEIQSDLLISKRVDRNMLLEDGVIVESNGVNYWFNEKFLNNFITATQITEKVGGTFVTWESDSKEWHNIALSDAYIIGITGMQKIQDIYLNN